MILLLLGSCEPPEPRTYPVFVDTSEDEDDTGNPTGTDTSDTGGDDDAPDPVKVNFAGRVATVTGTPFGLDSTAVDATVSGYFTYDRSVEDSQPVEVDIGVYDHRDDTGPFTILIDGPTSVFVSGSSNPIASIDVAQQILLWIDGPQASDEGFERYCEVDGVEDQSIGIQLSFSPNNLESAFADDDLPSPFPFVDTVTWDLLTEVDIDFTIDNDDGTLGIQLNEVTEPPPQ